MTDDTQRTRTVTWQDPMLGAQAAITMSGLEYMQALIDGKFPPPPIAQLMNYRLVKVEAGRAVFHGWPGEYLYNPIGVVHGGYASTLLDSALGCAVHTSLPQGVAYTTVQLNVHLVRGITKDIEQVICEAQVVHGGRRMATAEATLVDTAGKRYAHGTTTCMIFPLNAAS